MNAEDTKLSKTRYLWKILKEVGIPDHLTCLLRNLYAGQEAMPMVTAAMKLKDAYSLEGKL